MKPLAFALGAVALLGLSFAEEAAAQGGAGRDRVCVYEHADYGGWEQCFGPGESVRDFGKRRDEVSSLRVYGRVEVTLYEHPDFQGREVVLGENVPNLKALRGWNDETDGLRVEPASFAGRPRPGQRGEDRVCVYQHVGYRGKSECFDAGEDMPNLRAIGWNDGISSIRVFGRTPVAFYQDSDFHGERLIVNDSIPDLTRLEARDGGNWNDRISSFRTGDDRRRRRR